MPAEFLRLATVDRRRVAELAAEAVVVLPIGAVEQHGPSLPLGTDALLAETVAEAGMAASGADRPLVLAPTMPYGNSVHHLFACAASLSSATLSLVLRDLIDSLVRSGFRRIFVLNGHGGNDECVHLAVKDAVNRHEVVVGAASYWTLAPREGFAAGSVPGHAGGFEASLLLAARGDLVGSGFAAARPTGPPMTHTEDFGPGVTVVRSGDWARGGGFTDDPGRADVEVGRECLRALGRRLGEVLDRFAAVELPGEETG